MAPIKSSLAKTAKQLLGLRNTADLGLRGATQRSRFVPPPPIDATGGTKSTSGIYTLHAFTSSGTFTISSGEGDVDYFVVAGGGGGGHTIGGGGGGGGIARGTISDMGPGPYTVTIGDGGSGSTAPSSPGGAGQNSVFSTIIAAGGGGGGSEGPNGQPGGSGGGSGHSGGVISIGSGNRYPSVSPTPSPLQGQPVTPTPQGFDGGNRLNPGPSAYMAGGGGGAGEVRQDGQNPSTSGRGGAGINYPWVPPSYGDSGYFGGGGGGGADTTRSVSRGAGSPNGGGGAGSSGSPAGVSGTANTGGGGGGGSYTGNRPTGGAGGSGFVMVRYLT